MEERVSIFEIAKSRFPVTPYKVQLDFVEALLSDLEGSRKAIFLESPTGTGKSYSLLVSLITWLQKRLEKQKQASSTTTTPPSEVRSSGMPSWLKSTKQSKLEREKAVYLAQNRKKLQQIQNSKIGIHHFPVPGQKRISKQTPTQPEQSSSDEQQQEEDPFKHNQGHTAGIKRKMGLPSSLNPEKNLLDQGTSYRPPTIILTSRTHTQLSQLMAAFQKLKTQLRCVVFASKNHLCVNPDIKKLKDQSLQNGANAEQCDRLCKKLMQNKKGKPRCGYYSKSSYSEFINVGMQEALALGSKYQLCPYYAIKNVMEVAHILLVPYSTVLNRTARQRLGIKIQNAVVVFDEGHNVVEQDMESLSPELQYNQLCVLSSQIQDYLAKYTKLKSKKKFWLKQAVSIITATLEFLKKYGSEIKGEYLKLGAVDFLVQLGLREVPIASIREVILWEYPTLINQIVGNHPSGPAVFEKFVTFYQTLVLGEHDVTVLFKKASTNQTQSTSHTGSLKILAFKPDSLAQVVEECRSAVFAGGTLFPLNEFNHITSKYPADKIGTHVFSHEIPLENCQVRIVKTFQTKPVVYTHEQRNSNLALVRYLVERACRELPKGKGIVVFIQSYAFLTKVKQSLTSSNILQSCIFDDNSKNQNADLCFKAYETRIKSGKESVLFSVMGGKLSQGINFSDDLARLVLIFGLPFPNSKSPQIIQRMREYDRLSSKSSPSSKQNQLNGQGYYQNLCMRVVNQTMGRAIRHIKDHALIVCVDARFERMKQKFSKWLLNRTHIVEKAQELQLTYQLLKT